MNEGKIKLLHDCGTQIVCYRREKPKRSTGGNMREKPKVSNAPSSGVGIMLYTCFVATPKTAAVKFYLINIICIFSTHSVEMKKKTT